MRRKSKTSSEHSERHLTKQRCSVSSWCCHLLFCWFISCSHGGWTLKALFFISPLWQQSWSQISEFNCDVYVYIHNYSFFPFLRSYSHFLLSSCFFFSPLSPQVAIKIIDKTQLNPNSLQKVNSPSLSFIFPSYTHSRCGRFHLLIHEAQQIEY